MGLRGIALALFGFGAALQLLVYHFHWLAGCGWAERDSFKVLVVGDPQIEGTSKIEREGLKGEVDIWFNDRYMRHIVSSALGFRPQALIVLGDLLSSENIDPEEFALRAGRYKRIFDAGDLRSIHICGNHDIGYGSVMRRRHVDRFEEAFGAVNRVEELFGHRFVILNAMNLDEAFDRELRNGTWDFVARVEEQQSRGPLPLVLLTHIPLHKPEGSCADAPLVIRTAGGHVSKQNMLTPDTSSALLSRLRPKIIFSGHDHEGCQHPHGDAMEYTIRSIMGEYSGYTAFFEIIPDTRSGFRYRVVQCPFIHFIAIKVVLIASLIIQLLAVGALCCRACKQKPKQA